MPGDYLYAVNGTHASRSSLAYYQKIQYETAIQKQYAEHVKLYQILAKHKDNKIKGKQYSFLLEAEDGGNYIAVGESGYARAPNRRDGIPGYYNISGYQLSTLGISIPMEATKGSDATFLDVSPDEIEKATKRMQRHLGRQLFGDGTCLMGRVTNGGGSTTTGLIVDTGVYPKTNRHLRKNDTITFWSALTGNTARTGNSGVSTVTDVSADGTTFAIDAAVSDMGTTDYFTFNGNREYSSGDLYHEMAGLGAISSTSAVLGNINPATAGQGSWQAIVDMNGGAQRTYNPDLIFDAVMAAQEGDMDPDMWLTSKESVRVHNAVQSNLLRIGLGELGDVRRNKAELTFPTYSGSGEFTLSPQMDRYAPPGDHWIFPSEALKLMVFIDNEFLDKNIMERIPRSLYKEGQLCFAGQIVTLRRNVFVKVGDFGYTLLTIPR